MRLLFIYCLLLAGSTVFSQSNYNISLLGRWPYGTCEAIGIKNEIAIIGSGSAVEIINIEDTDSIFRLGVVDCIEEVIDIYISDQCAYVGTGSGIKILSISDIFNPEIIFSYPTNTWVDQVYKKNNLLFFSDMDTLKAIDIADLNNVNEISIFSVDWLSSFYIDGNIAFVLDYDGVYILDISDPDNPVELNFFDPSGIDHPSHIITENNIAYLTTGGSFLVGNENNGRLYLLDITDISSPQELSYIQCSGDWYSEGYKMDLLDSLLYLTVHNDVGDLMLIVDVNDVLSPTILGQYHVDSPGDIFVIVNKAYISDFENGMIVFNIEDPQMITETGHYYTAGFTADISVTGNYAFLANGSNGLRVIDVSNKTNPTQICTYKVPGIGYAGYTSIQVYEDLVYLSAYSHFKIIDVSNPQFPTLIGEMDPGLTKDIFISEGYAYSADRDDGLKIINISDPTSPSIVWDMNLGKTGFEVFVADNVCYLAAGDTGLIILNVTNPLNPEELSIIGSEDNTLGVFVKDTLVYIADRTAGLKIYNIAIPVNPLEVSIYNYGGFTSEVYVSGKYAYIIDGDLGLILLDISNPLQPVETGLYFSLNASEVQVSDNIIFIAERRTGFSILRNDLISDIQNSFENQPREYHLYQNYPNPSNPTTKIRFTVPVVVNAKFASRTNVILKVYDVLGGEITTLVDEEKSVGEYEVEFDGTGLPSGIYFYQLRAGSFVETKKMVLMK